MTELIIGIDLGTTNSMSAYVYPEGTALVKNNDRTTFMPSVVGYADHGVLTGYDAVAVAEAQPERTFYSFKRAMGKSPEDIKNELPYLPFKIETGENNTTVFPLDGRNITPEELSSEILKRIKTDTETFLNQPVKKAVVTVPAYYDNTQRQAVRNAALLAGIDPVRIINEPTAAAIAYGLDQKTKGKILVYDLGGGTFDVSVLELKGKIFRVLSTSGNTQLGGDDFDNIIADDIRLKYNQITGVNFPDTPKSRLYLKKTAEKLKIDLSASDSVDVEIVNSPEGKKINYQLTGESCRLLLEKKINETTKLVTLALKDAKIDKNAIDDVVLVGGSTRAPAVRRAIADYFNILIHTRINPDEVVALGASILGHLLSGGRRDFVLMDVIPLSLGIETIGGSFSKLIMKNSSIPAKITEVYSTSVDNQTAININIYQGEREMVKDCRLLGKIKVSHIPPMQAGFPKLEVTFMVDGNGILNVSALEVRSQKNAQIDLVPEHGLNPLKVKQMIEDSIEHVAEDFENRNLVDFKVKATMMIDGFNKIKSQARTMLGEEEFAAIDKSMSALKIILNGNNATAIKAAMDHSGKLTATITDKVISANISTALKDGEP